MRINELVELIIKKYQTRNPFEIAKKRNAIIVHAPLIDIRGFYQYFQRNNIIYINENLSDSEKIFVCAHELGHMIMHKDTNAVYMDTKTFLNTTKCEKEANIFAAELLIPDEIILENWNYTTEQLSQLLGYEQALIELRLKSYHEI